MSTENPDRPTQPPDHDAEPEEGPQRREQEFLEERTRRIRPKGAPDTGEAIPETPDKDDEGSTESIIEDRVGFDFRRRVVREYRERQSEKLGGPLRGAILGAEGAPEQPMPPAAPPANNWIPIGPSVVRQGQGGVRPATSGRTPAIAVAPGGNTVYIGAANGGVWRSDDAGVTWSSLMDAFDLNPSTPASDSLAVGALAVDPANPARLFVGSGEGPGGAYFGVGPIVTANGTATPVAWTTEDVAPGSQPLSGTAFWALAIDPNDANRVVAASRRGLYRREPNGSGGFHWAQKTLGSSSTTAVTSVLAAAAGGVTTFYAAQRNGQVYGSADGNTWAVVGAGFPGGIWRVALASRADDPSVLYALGSDGTVHRLATADGTWRLIGGVPAGFLGSQGTYDLAIAVAPDNVNRVYLGGSTILSGGDWSGSLYRCEMTVAGTTVSMTSTYIGGSIHADVHTIVFAPGDASKMWVGCDGGVFSTTNPTGSGDIFTSRNIGLQTLTMEYLAQHPTEEAVVFCGTQDNGCVRFTGEEAWLYSAGGDGGYEVINWSDPYRALSTYVYGSIRRTTNGGQRYAWTGVNVPLESGEGCRFYAPLAGTPPNPGSATAAADAALVAFGSNRPWISATFGGGWASIPNGTRAGDSLDGNIRSLTFATPNRLYAGTESGGVYRFDRSGAAWTRAQIDTVGGANQLPLAAPITDIAVDPADSGRVWVTLGGTGDWRHVWYFNGSSWVARSGPAAGSTASLLDVFASALVVDPANPTQLYLGADIGVWRTTDGGQNWQTYSEGLPDAAITDLAPHPSRGVLRAALHGRGVWERTIPDSAKQGVELYLRSTELDMGRRPVVNGLPDPTAPGQTVRFWRAPDIKLDTPDVNGQYQFPLSGTIDFLRFADTLTDDYQNVATHASATIVTRVYVQVHNRGVSPANNVRVMLLLTNASAGLPALPAGYDASVRNGLPINTPTWRTVGTVTLSDVRVGFPKIAAFSLPSSMLPQPANLAGNQHQCVLALLHHADDQFTSTQTNVDVVSRDDRKAAHKNLTVVQFTGTVPPEMPAIIPFRLNNAFAEAIRTSVRLELGRYPGRVRVLADGKGLSSKWSVRGLVPVDLDGGIRRWAAGQRELYRRNQRRRVRWDIRGSRASLAELSALMESGIGYEAHEPTVEIRAIGLKPGEARTLFLAFDRPKGKTPGAFPIEITQLDEDDGVIGGLSAQVEIVTTPEQERNGRRRRRPDERKTAPSSGHDVENPSPRGAHSKKQAGRS